MKSAGFLPYRREPGVLSGKFGAEPGIRNRRVTGPVVKFLPVITVIYGGFRVPWLGELDKPISSRIHTGGGLKFACVRTSLVIS